MADSDTYEESSWEPDSQELFEVEVEQRQVNNVSSDDDNDSFLIDDGNDELTETEDDLEGNSGLSVIDSDDGSVIIMEGSREASGSDLSEAEDNNESSDLDDIQEGNGGAEVQNVDQADAGSSRPFSRVGMSPPRKVAKLEGPDLNTSNASDQEDANNCNICYEVFTNSGEHRISCLKCGHVFGKSCIEKWLKIHGRCPQCNCKANKRDVRVLYVKCLRAMDNSELTAVKVELEKSQHLCSSYSLECAKLKVKAESLTQQVTFLQEQNKRKELSSNVMVMKSGCSSTTYEVPFAVPSTSAACKDPPGRKSLKFNFAKCFEMKDGNCRVGAYNESMNMLVVSQEMRNSLYPNGCCGIKQINLLELKPSHSFPIHQKQIRDMSYSLCQSDVLLSVGLDKKAVLFNCNGNVTVQMFMTDYPLWSCAWDEISQYVFYVGTTNGQIISYDIRSPAEAVGTFSVTNHGQDLSPVSRLKFVRPAYQSNAFNLSGLLVQKLNSVWFTELRGDNGQETRLHQLPLDGPFINVDFEPVSRHLLASARPSVRNNLPGSSHMVCDLTQTYDEPLGRNVVSANLIRTYQGGSRDSQKLCRPLIFSAEEGYSYVCANGPSNAVKVWDISLPETDFGYMGPAPDFVLDFVRAKVNQRNYMTLISEKGVRIFEERFNN